MRESLRIDSPFMGAGMPKAYSRDLRERVITAVETGASRREAARAFRGQRGVGGKVMAAALVSSTWRSAAPKPRGGRSFAVGRVRGRDFGSDRPTAGPDLGRNGCRTAQATDQNQLAARSGVFSTDTTSRSKKCAASSRTAASRCGAKRAAAGYESKVCLILPGWCLSTRPPSARTW